MTTTPAAAAAGAAGAAGAAATHPPLAASQAELIDVLLAAGRSRRHAGALAASATFGWRAVLKLKHDPKQLVDSAGCPACSA